MKQLLWVLILITGISHAQSLASAISNGDTAAVRMFIQEGADVNAMLDADGEEASPLRLAARANSLEIVKLLIEAGANPNGDSIAPLHVAAFNGNSAIVQYLLSKGAVMAHPKTGWTALHAASSGGHKDLAEYLISRGADAKAIDKDGQTPLMYATEYKIPLPKMLISNGAELNPTDNQGKSALDWAIDYGQKRTARYLKILGAMGGEEMRGQLFTAVSNDDLQTVEGLVSKGVSVNMNYEGVTPLIIALEQENNDMLKSLIQLGANPSLEDPAFRAAFQGRKDTLMILANAGARLRNPETGWTALHSASSGGHLDLAEWLITARRLNVNAQDVDGETPLMYSSRLEGVELAKLLVAKGADVNLQDNEEKNAYDWAVDFENQEAAEYLKTLMPKTASKPMVKAAAPTLQMSDEDMVSAIQGGDTQKVSQLAKKGFDLNSKISYEDDPLTPLEIASYLGDFKIVKTLISLGASANTTYSPAIIAAYRGHEDILKYLISQDASLKNNSGWTALHAASSGGHSNIVKYLLQQGQNPSAADDDGETPLMYAAEMNLDTVKILIAAGADPSMQDKRERTAYDWAVKADQGDIAAFLQPHTPINFSMAQGLIREGKWESLTNLQLPEDFFTQTAHFHDSEGHCGGESTLLQAAALCGDAKAAAWLLEKGSDINAANEERQTALMFASLINLDTVKTLVKAGADAALQDIERKTALDYALILEKEDIAAYLQAEFPTLKPYVDIRRIIFEGNVQALKDAGPTLEDVNKPIHYHSEDACLGEIPPLLAAAHTGNLEMVKALIALGADVTAVNAKGENASAVAGQGGHLEIVKFFRTTYPNMYSTWDILQIIQSRDTQTLKEASMPADALISKYHYHDENDNCFGDLSLLQIAVIGGDLATVEALTVLDADISADYPVMAASYKGYTNIASYLISQGSPLSIPGSGWTALHSAAGGGHVPMIEYFIAQKQDVNAVNSSGQTPLMLASRANLEAVQAFVKAKANVRLQDNNDKTALDYAVLSGKTDIIAYYNAQYPRIKPNPRPVENAFSPPNHLSSGAENCPRNFNFVSLPYRSSVR